MSFYLTEYLPVEVCSGIALHCQFLQSVLFSKRKSGIEFSIFKLCCPLLDLVNRNCDFSGRKQTYSKSKKYSNQFGSYYRWQYYPQNAFKLKILHYIIAHVIKTALSGLGIVNVHERDCGGKYTDQENKQYLNSKSELKRLFDKKVAQWFTEISVAHGSIPPICSGL